MGMGAQAGAGTVPGACFSLALIVDGGLIWAPGAGMLSPLRIMALACDKV